MRAVAGSDAPLLRRLDSVGGSLDPDALEEAYSHPPGVLRANLAVSLDGAVELEGRSGALGGPADRQLFSVLRSLADVVLVGAGTARAEGYGPVWMRPSRRDRRVARGQAPLPTLAVVTASADLDPSLRLFGERRDDQPAPPHPIVLTCAAADAERRSRLAEVADVRVLGDREVDLAAALASLQAGPGGPGGVRTLTEGGPRLLGDLVAGGLLDELCLTHSPLVVGPDRVGLSRGWRLPPGRAVPSFALEALHAGGGRLFARYRVERGRG